MNILLTAKHPPGGRAGIGGVQTWVQTVAHELRRTGHQATVWGPEWPRPTGRYELGIFANAKHTRQVMALCKTRLVISHGIIPAEQPVAGTLYGFTSDEVRAHWNMPGQVFNQPIDLDFWTPGGKPSNVLVRSSYRAGLPWLPVVAERLNMRYYHASDLSAHNLRNKYRAAGCVIATGRAAVEAMACGAPVVICDDRPYQGPLMDPDTTGAMKRNYSGRGGFRPNAPTVTAAIEDACRVGSLRGHVEQHHNVQNIVKEILNYVC